MGLCLAVTFWGEEYRRYFLDFCLSSLLAPGNLPAISDKSSARLFVATNDKGWDALQSEPAFIAAKTFVQVEHVPFEVRAYSSAHEKMLIMSQAHKLLAGRMVKEQAIGVFLYPDMLAATGYIKKLEELQRQGFKVVMFMNVRFANEGLLKELRENNLVRPGIPLALPSKELVRLTLRHMHSEMRRSGFDDGYDDYGCTSYFWAVDRDDLLFHCGNWVPALIDYGSIDAHDDTGQLVAACVRLRNLNQLPVRNRPPERRQLDACGEPGGCGRKPIASLEGAADTRTRILRLGQLHHSPGFGLPEHHRQQPVVRCHECIAARLGRDPASHRTDPWIHDA